MHNQDEWWKVCGIWSKKYATFSWIPPSVWHWSYQMNSMTYVSSSSVVAARYPVYLSPWIFSLHIKFLTSLIGVKINEPYRFTYITINFPELSKHLTLEHIFYIKKVINRTCFISSTIVYFNRNNKTLSKTMKLIKLLRLVNLQLAKIIELMLAIYNPSFNNLSTKIWQ